MNIETVKKVSKINQRRYKKMSKMNVMKKIQEARGGINSYYDMDIEDMEKISDNSNDRFSLISNAFTFGYIQGMKAQKAKDRKKKA